jgi:hypothetical protein
MLAAGGACATSLFCMSRYGKSGHDGRFSEWLEA